MRLRLIVILCALVMLVTAPQISAAVPQQISHQGVVAVNGQRFNGTGTFYFALVGNGGAGTNLWTNDGTQPGTSNHPTDGVPLSVADGVYAANLGGGTMTPIEPAVFNNANVVLRIWFKDAPVEEPGNGVQQIAPDQTMQSVPYAMTAGGIVGEVRMWGGAIARMPAGWRLCNGDTVSRSTYSELYNIIEETYGSGDGSETFNLPDFRDRSPMGAVQDDGLVAKSLVGGGLAQVGGAAVHKLTIDEMPSHNHRQALHCWSLSGAGPITYTSGACTPNTAVLFTNNTGGDMPHNNLHPWFSVVYMIYTGVIE